MPWRKTGTILQFKDANSLSPCLKWHLIIADVIPHKHPPPISRVGVRQCPRIETSPPKHAPERTESRTPATLAQKTRGAAMIRLCGDPKENWSRLGDTRQEEKRRSCLYRIGRAHRRLRTAQAGRASTRQKKTRETSPRPSIATHAHSLRRHTTALPIMSSLVVA